MSCITLNSYELPNNFKPSFALVDQQNVGTIPASTYEAVEAAHRKYMAYLSAFGGDEVFLRKKVELELGGVLLQIKQRLTGMDPKWSEVSPNHCGTMRDFLGLTSSTGGCRNLSLMLMQIAFLTADQCAWNIWAGEFIHREEKTAWLVRCQHLIVHFTIDLIDHHL